MQISLPHSESHPQIRVTVKLPKSEVVVSDMDDSHKVFDLQLPEGVSEDDVEVACQFLTRNSKPDGAVTILKAKVEKKHASKAGLPEKREEAKAEERKSYVKQASPLGTPEVTATFDNTSPSVEIARAER